MQTFEQWWNEIEGYGLRAERFTTPDDAAKAAWDQAMSLRAQADARPVARFHFDESELDALYEAIEWAKDEGLPGTAEHLQAIFDAHDPEASAPGLSEDEWLALAERHIRADWNSEQPDGYLNAVKALVQDAMSLTRASAATVAEPSKYRDSTPQLNVGDSSFESWFSRYVSAHKGTKQQMRDAYAAGMGDPLVVAREAAQQQAEPSLAFDYANKVVAERLGNMQQAEPGADERAEFETALKQYAEACHRSESCSAMDAARARVCAIFYRAAQSGQRAGDEHSPSLPVIQRMMQTLTKCGVSYGEGGAEMFFARLDDNIYALCRAVDRLLETLSASQPDQRAGMAEPEGWREFITEVAQKKPEKPDHWSPCGQCRNNAERAQDLIAAPTQQQEGGK